MRAALLLVGATGCSFLGSGSSNTKPVDAAIDPNVDGPVHEILLKQTNTEAISGMSWSCSEPGTGYNQPNTYYRVFDLESAGVTRPLQIMTVTFATQVATSPVGHQGVTISIGTYAGTVGDTIDDGLITEVASKQIMVPDSINKTITTAFSGVSVAADARLVVSLIVPDGRTDHASVLFGTNGDGESGHTYWMASVCNVNTPIWMDSYAVNNGLGKSELLLEVRGEY